MNTQQGKAEFLATLEKVDCGTCSACCRNQEVYMRPGDDPAIFDQTRTVIDPNTGGPNRILPQLPNGDCAYLGERGCTIYAKRPKICRAFSCKGFAWLQQERMRGMTNSAKRAWLRQIGPPGSPYRIGLDKLARGE